jgi:hypothetical protein
MGAGFMMLQGVAYPPLPCRASPPQGGRSATGEHPAHGTGERGISISPLEGEMPGRAEGGITCSKATIAC